MTVIDFPNRHKPALVNSELTPTPPDQLDLGDTLEAAFDVHRMIFNAMRMGDLRNSPGSLRSMVLYAMEHHFGPELVWWAELQFKAVYGIDTRTFIKRVAAYVD